MIYRGFEIETESFISADNKKLLKIFNDKYDDWVYCGENEQSFNECQNKLIYILKFILDTLQNSNGFIQLCKVEPPIKLRSYPDENSRDLCEILELREMLHHCIEVPHEAIDMDDFEITEEEQVLVIEKNNEIHNIQNEICQYQDVNWIYLNDDDNTNTDDPDETDNLPVSRGLLRPFRLHG